METKSRNSRRTTLTMTNTEKKELIRRTRHIKDVKELRKVKEEFYKEIGVERPTIQDRWESDAELYNK